MEREALRAKEYFDMYIEKRKDERKDLAELLENKRVSNERRNLVWGLIFECQLFSFVAKYSRGDSICTLQLEYKQLVELWRKSCTLESLEAIYEENLWFVSMAVLFEDESIIIDTIKETLKNTNINDWLLNFLLSSADTKPEQIEGQLLIPEKYQTLKEVICKNDKAKLMHYLETEWYSNCKDYGWYDSHKLRRRSQNIYFGYWCFEAGAIVKKLNWKDTEFAKQQYYPYDLVHYKE